MRSGSPLAVFFNGPESAEAAMCFAASGAPVQLLGKSRDELDVAGRKIIETMDALVRDGVLDTQQRFAVYSHVHKIVADELAQDVSVYLDASTDEDAVAANETFLATRPKGLILNLRRGDVPAVATGGSHARLVLRVGEPFAQASEVQVSAAREEDRPALEKAKEDLAAVLEAMGKKAVFT